MADDIPFDRDFTAPPGRADLIAPKVRRVLAPNPGPFTFTGTCSYIIGEGEVAILDPGPDDHAHIDALFKAVDGEKIAQVFVTHTHRDHSPATAAIVEKTGAKVFAEGPHRAARPMQLDEKSRLDASADLDFTPDVRLADGEIVEGKGYALEAVTTPGHTMNHLAFALRGTDILFSGDHVMAWSTSIVAPPDGAMGDYMTSLQKLKKRSEALYFPGHGPPVKNAQAFVDRYIAHRNARETAILRSLERGETDIPTLVRAIYIGLDPRLTGAAGLMTLAQLEDLVERGIVATDGTPALSSRFRLA
ncbi:MAG TPA: MBL fold metallo-hydrolase [Xanthobacteraceae bacterium]|nr:MBL fold metallo-hydrolase [Xanthobacteraceae bacterium]